MFSPVRRNIDRNVNSLPRGPPSKYYPGPTMLNFCANLIWSTVITISKSKASLYTKSSIFSHFGYVETVFAYNLRKNVFTFSCELNDFWHFHFFSIMCGSNWWFTTPLSGRVGKITAIYSPTPWDITKKKYPNPRDITELSCPTHGIITAFFVKKKWYSPPSPTGGW